MHAASERIIIWFCRQSRQSADEVDQIVEIHGGVNVHAYAIRARALYAKICSVCCYRSRQICRQHCSTFSIMLRLAMRWVLVECRNRPLCWLLRLLSSSETCSEPSSFSRPPVPPPGSNPVRLAQQRLGSWRCTVQGFARVYFALVEFALVTAITLTCYVMIVKRQFGIQEARDLLSVNGYSMTYLFVM